MTEVCPWSLGFSNHPTMPKTCHQNHQRDMGRACCSPAPAAAQPPAVCVPNFSWEFLQIRNAFTLLHRGQQSKIKYLLVIE